MEYGMMLTPSGVHQHLIDRLPIDITSAIGSFPNPRVEEGTVPVLVHVVLPSRLFLGMALISLLVAIMPTVSPGVPASQTISFVAVVVSPALVVLTHILVEEMIRERWSSSTTPSFTSLGNGGSLIFERDLDALSEHLERPHPEFFGTQVNDQPGGELQWVVVASLRGKMEPPMSRGSSSSIRESNWLDGLARALQEALLPVCGAKCDS
ncbi:hypothetical protein QYE76_060063 [Lolium multiflorum]|uniref:Uncharacterized protein n=1 Tax=Lolium multiflorum TaxID=4521 RepID=A0AAD8W3W9_LOLMU|nr:hypothetical protein QYE76_060063 [Lolium multiflorum]